MNSKTKEPNDKSNNQTPEGMHELEDNKPHQHPQGLKSIRGWSLYSVD